MKQSSFKSNFQKKVAYFIKNDLKKIRKNLKSASVKFNGANQIIEDIIESYEKS